MIVIPVGTGHVLVLNTSDTLTDLLTLNASNIPQHVLITEVLFSQVAGRQGGSVVSWQGDQVQFAG